MPESEETKQEVKKVTHAFGIPMESSPIPKELERAIEEWYPFYEAQTYDEDEEQE